MSFSWGSNFWGDPGGGNGNFYGGSMDVSNLIPQAVAALLHPDCAALFGGFRNAVTSLINSSYNWYVPGQANPFPNQITSAMWQGTVLSFQNQSALATTEPQYARGTPAGGIIFFLHSFSNYPPGFGTGSSSVGQMTVFMHEQEHATNHYLALDNAIDSNYPLDDQKINGRCHPQIQQESSPITGGLTPP